MRAQLINLVLACALAGCISLDAGDIVAVPAPESQIPQPGQLGGTLLATLDVQASEFRVLNVTGSPPWTIAINGATQPLVLGQPINLPGGVYQVRIEDSEGAFFSTQVELSQ